MPFMRPADTIGGVEWVMISSFNVSKKACLLAAIVLASASFIVFSDPGPSESAADGADFTYGDLNYTVISTTEKTVMVTGFESTVPSELTIPGTVTYGSAPYHVTSIDHHAFLGCSGLTSLTVPDSVGSIGAGAFQGCSDLTSLTILGSVGSIGPGAFQGCSGLTSLSIPGSVTSIGDNYAAFQGMRFYAEDGETELDHSVGNLCGHTFAGTYDHMVRGDYVVYNVVTLTNGGNVTGFTYTVNGGDVRTYDGAFTVDHGDVLVVTALFDDVYRFKSWSGYSDGTDNPLTVDGVTADISLMATADRHTTGGPTGAQIAIAVGIAAAIIAILALAWRRSVAD